MISPALVVERLNGSRSGEQILQLRGSLTINNLFEFQNSVRLEPASIQILDFTSVPYVDSAGVGALIGAFIAAQKAGRRIILVGLNERVRALLQMTNVAALFTTFVSIAQTEAALA